MVRKALVPCGVGLVGATVLGWLIAGPGAAASAALGITVIFANFAAQGLSLAWASTISIVMVQVVALVGFIVRLGIILAALFLLDSFGWFSPLAFALAALPALVLLLVYEARLVMRGLGGTLQIPADGAAIRAHEVLTAKENV
jgi:hypothetical protein